MSATPSLSFRHATEADLPLLYACDAYAQSHEGRRHDLRNWVQQGSCILTMAKDAPLGFVVLDYGFFGHGFVPLVCVAGEHQGQGVGLALLAEVKRQCRTQKLFTSTNASNQRAQALLGRAGFVRSGMIENLDEGDPEIVYFKPIHR